MSQLSFANHKKNKLVALLDIGSSSVGGALVAFSSEKDGASPTVLWSKRNEIPFQETVNIEHFLQGILSALKTVAKAMSVEAKEHPTAIFCTLSSPWCLSQTRVAKSSFAQPSIVTQKIIDALVDAEAASFRSGLASYLESGVILEQKIMRVELNGYATQKPYGERAQDIDISLYMSATPQSFLNTIRQSIEEIFHRSVDQYHSLALVSFSAFRDIFPERENFLICDIGGEVTDLSLVKNNILVETVSFPKGMMMFIRDAVSLLKRPPEEVLSRLALHFGGRHDDTLSAKFDSLVTEGRNKWLSSFREAIAELRSRNFLPDEIELTAHPIIEKWIGPSLSQTPFAVGISGVGGGNLKTHIIDAAFLRKLVSFKDIVDVDSFLALEALFAGKILNLN